VSLLLKFGQKGLVGTDSHLICSLFPLDVGPKIKQTNKIQKRENPHNEEKNEQSRKILSLWLCHPKHAQSRLLPEAKQGQAWLVLGWETNLQKRLLRETNSLETKGGMPSKFKWSHLCQTSQK
jgi:hypothetical protein